jgi:hypothetical protein
LSCNNEREYRVLEMHGVTIEDDDEKAMRGWDGQTQRYLQIQLAPVPVDVQSREKSDWQ